MPSLSLSNILRIGLAIMLLFVAVQAWTHFHSTQEARAVFENNITVNYLTSEKLAEMLKTAHEMRRYEKELFIYIAGAKRDKYIKDWTAAHESLEARLKEFQQNPVYRFSADELDQLRKWSRALEFYGSEFRRIIAASDPNQSTADRTEAPLTTVTANEAIGPGKDELTALFTGAQQLTEARKQLSEQAYASIKAEFRANNIIGLSLAAGGFLIGIVMMLALPRALTGPLASFTKLVEEMSRNLVSDKVDERSVAAEFRSLALSLERLRNSQAGLVARLRRKLPSDPEPERQVA